MEIKKICMGPVQTNCYLLKLNHKVIVIDPSFTTEKEVKKFENALQEEDEIVAILLTHGHYDHISGCNYLLSQYNCPVYISFDEVEFLTDSHLNLSTQFRLDYTVEKLPIEVVAGELIVDDFHFNVVNTPGHTHGSITYIIEDNAFIGDFIFKGSIGRTDLPTGSKQEMENSLRQFLTANNSKLKLYPGHGELTTLGYEAMTNPYLNF